MLSFFSLIGSIFAADEYYFNLQYTGAISKNEEKDDKIILTDVYVNRVLYQVYDNYKTSLKDISCLNQNTENEKEITLITCTMGATKRVIVKAIEVYD